MSLINHDASHISKIWSFLIDYSLFDLCMSMSTLFFLFPLRHRYIAVFVYISLSAGLRVVPYKFCTCWAWLAKALYTHAVLVCPALVRLMSACRPIQFTRMFHAIFPLQFQPQRMQLSHRFWNDVLRYAFLFDVFDLNTQPIYICVSCLLTQLINNNFRIHCNYYPLLTSLNECPRCPLLERGVGSVWKK